jgi:acetyl-CoA C-acetyltransferase
VVDTDEQPGKGRPDKIPTLRAAFAKDGTITAASSSSISDGAAAVVLTRASTAEAKGLKPVAKLVATAAHAQEPREFTIAPVGAVKKVLDKAGWSIDDVDLFEVNEAFACVAMFAMIDLGIPTTRSTSTAAPRRWATRSAPRARASSPRCWALCASAG